MSRFQPEVLSSVVLFAPRSAPPLAAPRAGGLTMHDRIAITMWQDRARLAGYDRMVIHETDGDDAHGTENFLSVYRCGEAWSRWGFARLGDTVQAWCCLTGVDVGAFLNLPEALEAVLQRTATISAA